MWIGNNLLTEKYYILYIDWEKYNHNFCLILHFNIHRKLSNVARRENEIPCSRYYLTCLETVRFCAIYKHVIRNKVPNAQVSVSQVRICSTVKYMNLSILVLMTKLFYSFRRIVCIIIYLRLDLLTIMIWATRELDNHLNIFRIVTMDDNHPR